MDEERKSLLSVPVGGRRWVFHVTSRDEMGNIETIEGESATRKVTIQVTGRDYTGLIETIEMEKW